MSKVVTFGEIMLRLAPQGFLRFSQANNFDVVYGGGESNVAVSLANYGVSVDFVTRLPKNDIGECAMMGMVSLDGYYTCYFSRICRCMFRSCKSC